METAHPDNAVHSVQHLAQGTQAARVDMRTAQPRADERSITTAPNSDDPVRYDAIGKDANGEIVTGGRVAGYRVDSDEAQQIVKNINTQTDLKISRWSEIAGYLRWGTIGLMTLTFSAFTAGATAGASTFLGGLSSMTLASVGVALVSGPFLGLAAASFVCAAATMMMTQNVRKLQTDRWMDVQGFMQERTATKIGKEVAQAMGREPAEAPLYRADGKRWQDVAVSEQDQNVSAAR